MEFVPRPSINFEENCTKTQCKYCKRSNQLYSCQSYGVAVIIGVRLGIVDHRNDNLQVFNFCLEKSDSDAIDAVCTKSTNLFEIIGDVRETHKKRSKRWILILVIRSGQFVRSVWEFLGDHYSYRAG
jgi:hypothetical protein